MVAHTRCKTPTAVAEFLISCLDEALDALVEFQHGIIGLAEQLLQKETARLQRVSMQVPHLVNDLLYENKNAMAVLSQKLALKSKLYFTRKDHQLALLEKEVAMSSPQLLLKRGYSLTLKDGKILKSKTQVKAGDKIVTRLADGEIRSEIVSE
jgi:exodeoxyribonuclease VII large subunit